MTGQRPTAEQMMSRLRALEERRPGALREIARGLRALQADDVDEELEPGVDAATAMADAERLLDEADRTDGWTA